MGEDEEYEKGLAWEQREHKRNKRGNTVAKSSLEQLHIDCTQRFPPGVSSSLK